jgi:hypothetical protein
MVFATLELSMMVKPFDADVSAITAAADSLLMSASRACCKFASETARSKTLVEQKSSEA